MRMKAGTKRVGEQHALSFGFFVLSAIWLETEGFSHAQLL
jgi:hypothetical protein